MAVLVCLYQGFVFMSATWRHGRLMHLSKLTYVMAEGLVQIAPQPGPHCPPLYEERCPDCVQAVLALAGATAGGSGGGHTGRDCQPRRPLNSRASRVLAGAECECDVGAWRGIIWMYVMRSWVETQAAGDRAGGKESPGTPSPRQDDRHGKHK